MYIVLFSRPGKFVMGHEIVRYAGKDGEVEEFVYLAATFGTRDEALAEGSRCLEKLEGKNWKMEVIRK